MELPTSDAAPWWLVWVVPITALMGLIGAALIWIGRVILLPGVKQEIEEMLSDKFDEAKREVQERHEQNRAQWEQINERLDESASDRRELHKDLSEVKEDVAYLRGKSSGTFKRP